MVGGVRDPHLAQYRKRSLCFDAQDIYVWRKDVVRGAKIEESIVSGPNPAGGAYVPSLDDRVMEVRQFVMGRKTLGAIAGEFGLYGYEKERPESSESENAIRAMRGSIKVEPTKDKLFIVLSFLSEDPIMARDVAGKLGDLFIEETLKDRERGVEAAEEFLEQELKRAKSDLEAKEKVISEFKQQHLGELPQQIDANLHKLDRLQDDMKSQSDLAQTLSSRLIQLDKAIRDYEETGEASDVPGISGTTKKTRIQGLLGLRTSSDEWLSFRRCTKTLIRISFKSKKS
ncbi:MAG: hypothetical protein U0231_20000 [Nitrospiraceae bacterium]